MRAVARLSLLALALAVLPPATAAHAATRHVPRGWLGVVADGPLMSAGFEGADAEWNRLAASGAETVRVAFPWPALQPDGAATTDFSTLDPVVLSAASRGLSVLPVVTGTPRWARLHRGDAASPPRRTRDYANLLGALVARYGPHGALWSEHREVKARPIRAWQVWNEPNLTAYWNAKRWARGYVKLLRAAHKALQRADRGSTTVLAGLPNYSWIALRHIYEAGGRGAFDAVALHPYTGKPANVLRIVRYARKVMRRAHDGRRPVWITELSWPASVGHAKGPEGFVTTERGQASRLRKALPLLARERRELRIAHVFWYTWLSAEGRDSAFDWSGLRRLRGDGSIVSAPALSAFQDAARRLEGCRKRWGDATRCR